MVDEPMKDSPTDKRLTGTPDTSIFVEGATLPVGSMWNKLKNPLEGQTYFFVPYDPSTGSYCEPMRYNPSTGKGETQRTTSSIKSAQQTATGPTAIWTPATGKRFRLLQLIIMLNAGMAAAGTNLISFFDNATDTNIDVTVWLPIAASIANQPPLVISLPGNGLLSAAINNPLKVSLGTAITAGAISIIMVGCEE